MIKTLVIMFAAAVKRRNLSKSIQEPRVLGYHDLEIGEHWKVLAQNAAE